MFLRFRNREFQTFPFCVGEVLREPRVVDVDSLHRFPRVAGGKLENMFAPEQLPGRAAQQVRVLMP